jgi:hypothetical protein
MYNTMHRVGTGAFLLRESGPLVLSLILAEALYKLHSFTLEALAFLGTWYALSFAASKLFGSTREV